MMRKTTQKPPCGSIVCLYEASGSSRRASAEERSSALPARARATEGITRAGRPGGSSGCGRCAYRDHARPLRKLTPFRPTRFGRTASARQQRGTPRRGVWRGPRSQPAVQDRCAGRALDRRAADCADAPPVPTAVSLVRSYPEPSRAAAFGREALPIAFRQTLLGGLTKGVG